MTDPIADMLTQIRNAQAVLKPEVQLSFSKTKYQIAKILEKENKIESVKKGGRGAKKKLIIELKYEGKVPSILGLKKISKPGQRIYTSAQEIRPVRSGFGVSIVSTSRGIMTGKEAKKKNLGGEVICEIW